MKNRAGKAALQSLAAVVGSCNPARELSRTAGAQHCYRNASLMKAGMTRQRLSGTGRCRFWSGLVALVLRIGCRLFLAVRCASIAMVAGARGLSEACAPDFI